MQRRLWEVVGGGDKGGIIVREGESLKSPQCSERLATGATVREIDLWGERLNYKKVWGAGPETGWVSIELKGKELLRPVDERPAHTREESPSDPTPTVEYVSYSNESSPDAKPAVELANTEVESPADAPTAVEHSSSEVESATDTPAVLESVSAEVESPFDTTPVPEPVGHEEESPSDATPAEEHPSNEVGSQNDATSNAEGEAEVHSVEQFFSQMFDEEDRIAQLQRMPISDELKELLRVEHASPSYWLPWVPSVRGMDVGKSHSQMSCLLWLAKKARLGQDAFLIAPPGANCRHLALQFCAMAEREVTYLSLSRDTTESDLKQRREIINGNVVFANQPPVDAALNGRVLILEGIEKAERNVLPLLNNLLENREMQLEDGSFLLAPHKRHLLKGMHENGKTTASLLPVSPNFLVIAIGLPVPRYRGMPLDPPLRSRFAAYMVEAPPSAEEIQTLQEIAPAASPSEVRNLVETINKLRGGPRQAVDTPRLPHPSEEGMRSAMKLRDLFPSLTPSEALHRVFPHRSIYLDEERRKTLSTVLGHRLGGDAGSLTGSGYASAKVTELLDPGATYVQDGPFREWEVPPRGVAMMAFPARSAATASGGGRDLSILSVRQLREEARKVGLNVEKLPPEKADIVRAIRAHRGGGTSDRRSPSSKSIAALHGSGVMKGNTTAFAGLVSSQHNALIALLQDHCVNVDLCLIGERGVGKTLLTRRFAQVLGYKRFTTFCFQDMTSRELTARRSTDPSGNTTWQWSPLVEAAISGELAVLDGIHRLPNGTLAATVGRLVHDRELDLPDGSRLVCWDHWQALRLNKSAAQLRAAKIHLVHPSFRIMCTAEPPAMGKDWLDEQLMSLFHFTQVDAPSDAEYAELLAQSKRPPPPSHVRGLHTLAAAIRDQAEREPQLFRPISFSTRRILQVGQYAGWQGDLGEAVAMALHAPVRFLPQGGQDILKSIFSKAEKQGLPSVPISTVSGTVTNKPPKEKRPGEVLAALELEAIALHLNIDAYSVAYGSGREVPYGKDMSASAMKARIEDTKADLSRSKVTSQRQHLQQIQREAQKAVEDLGGNFNRRTPLKIVTSGGEVRIGGVSVPVEIPARAELVPKDHFVDIPAHIAVLQRLLLDYKLGNHTLLIGNQGVGKNKIADRLLALLGKEREYVQLHRDTTVASLVMTPTLKGGAVVWEDSPLVRAVRHGRVLMVDEADKAPLEVVCVLKSLVEDCELCLPNGKRIGKLDESVDDSEDDRVIWMHPGFRMIVLANRPGFPFLGNDFYRECGDVFASVVVDNPDMRSEAELLQSYGPDVPKSKLAKILSLFATLREQVETGKISYPYSAREAVKIIEHLNRFPSDSLEQACRDVFSFDFQNPAALQLLSDSAGLNGIQFRIVDGDATTDEIYEVLRKEERKFDTKGGPQGGAIYNKNAPVDDERLNQPAKDPNFDWKAKERPDWTISQAQLDDGIKQLENFGAAGEAMPDRRRGLEKLPEGKNNESHWQAKGWGLRMNGGQAHGAWGLGVSKPSIGASGFGIALGGPVEGAPVAQTLPPDMQHLKFPDRINFRQNVLEHIQKEVELAKEEGRFKSSHLGGDSSIKAHDSVSGTGSGSGTGEGSGDGKGRGTGRGEGEGSGEGRGSGDGKGEGTGSGEGTGGEEGKGEGQGKGEGKGEGQGKGEGRGAGQGKGEGKGRGTGTGEGRGGGRGKGEGAGQGQGRGAGSGGKAGKGAGKDAEGYEVPLEPGVTREENNTYEDVLQKIQGPLLQMRRLLERHVAKEREREWQSFLTDGELDDGLVVDGVCGQQNVYRRRTTAADPSFFVKKPKRLMFAVDLSLSMSVFNMLDQRLERLCEATVFLLEAFAGYEDKYEFGFVGFSGAGPAAVKLADFGKPPRSRKQRIDMINAMKRHAKSVQTGDSTMQATKLAIETVAGKDADEHFAFIVSDAEVERYGITPDAWNNTLMKTDSKVKAYAILISMENDKVESYRTGFEPGHGFLCESSDDLVGIFQKIFDTALFK